MKTYKLWLRHHGSFELDMYMGRFDTQEEAQEYIDQHPSISDRLWIEEVFEPYDFPYQARKE